MKLLIARQNTFHYKFRINSVNFDFGSIKRSAIINILLLCGKLRATGSSDSTSGNKNKQQQHDYCYRDRPVLLWYNCY